MTQLTMNMGPLVRKPVLKGSDQFLKPNDQCHEKICLQGLRQGLTQTYCVQSHKMARGLKFRISEVEGL